MVTAISLTGRFLGRSWRKLAASTFSAFHQSFRWLIKFTITLIVTDLSANLAVPLVLNYRGILGSSKRMQLSLFVGIADRLAFSRVLAVDFAFSVRCDDKKSAANSIIPEIDTRHFCLLVTFQSFQEAYIRTSAAHWFRLFP